MGAKPILYHVGCGYVILRNNTGTVTDSARLLDFISVPSRNCSNQTSSDKSMTSSHRKRQIHYDVLGLAGSLTLVRKNKF